MTKNNNKYDEANGILKQLEEYSNELIEESLADIHKRTEKVIKYNYLEGEEKRSSPVYYRINTVKQMHTETTDAYYSFTQTNELGDKVRIIGKISTMDRTLVDIEGGFEDDE